MESYKERMIDEYRQLKIKYEKLKNFCNKIKAAEIKGVEAPKHDCPLELLRHQQSIMGEYLDILELRAHIEGVPLEPESWLGTYGHKCECIQEASVNIKAEKPATNHTGDTDGDSFKTHLLHYLINKGYKYIAGDTDGEFYVYKIKPTVGFASWVPDKQDNIFYMDEIFMELFTGLKYGMDTEPVKLTDLLEG